MSDQDKDVLKPGDEGYVAPVPSGYIPGRDELDLPAGQNVGDRGEVIPSPEDILEQERQALADQQEGGSGSAGSPDTAAAGAEHEDR